MNASLITALGGLGAALLTVVGVLIQLARYRSDVRSELRANGGSSLRDSVDRIETDVREVRKTQTQHGQRLATVETRLCDHLSRSQ